MTGLLNFLKQIHRMAADKDIILKLEIDIFISCGLGFHAFDDPMMPYRYICDYKKKTNGIL